jgi:hypothetical protein
MRAGPSVMMVRTAASSQILRLPEGVAHVQLEGIFIALVT